MDFLTLKNRILERSSSLVGVDLGRGAIRVVELGSCRGGSSGKATPVRWGVREIKSAAYGSEERLAASLRELLIEAKIRSRRFAVALPAQRVFTKVLRLPQGPLEELASKVHSEVIAETALKHDQIQIDYTVLPSPNLLEHRVFVAVARKADLRSVVSVIERIGGEVVIVDIEPLALYNAWYHYRPDYCAKALAIVQIHPCYVGVSIYRDRVPVVLREFPKDASENGAQVVARLGEAIASEIRLEAGAHLEAVVHVLISGEPLIAKGVQQILQGAVQAKICHGDSVMESELSVAVGLALRGF